MTSLMKSQNEFQNSLCNGWLYKPPEFSRRKFRSPCQHVTTVMDHCRHSHGHHETRGSNEWRPRYRPDKCRARGLGSSAEELMGDEIPMGKGLDGLDLSYQQSDSFVIFHVLSST